MNKLIKQILVPYDGTASSEKAIKYAFKLASLHQSQILTLTCIKDQATFGFFRLKSDKKSTEKQKEKAVKKIEMLKNHAREIGISLKSKIIKCDVASKEIIKYAKKENVDMIAMSKTKQGTTAEKIYNESTVDKVFREAPCTFIQIK